MKGKLPTLLIISILLFSMISATNGLAGSVDLNDNTYAEMVDSDVQITNQDQMVIEDNLSPQQAREPVQYSPYMDASLDRSEIRERGYLPQHYIYWEDAPVSVANVFQMSYISGDAIIKIYDDKMIELVVKTSTYQISSNVVSILNHYDAKIINSYPSLPAIVVNIPIYQMESFIVKMNTLAEVMYVEPSYYYSASFTPDDPEWINQYGPQLVGMETAWDINLGSTEIIVAIIDTGIDYTHPDLGNYLPIGYDWYWDDNDPMDDHGHGTHVAGTIAATINNMLGVAGMANVSFFAEKFLGPDGFGSDVAAAAAIMHAVDVGADILSNSWGGYGFSQILYDSVLYAVNASVIVVGAAGNDATSEPHYPAAFTETIAVAATDASDNVAGFSNYGEWVDISAPGVNIISTVPWGYDYFSGTSMSAPHVSGLLALLMSQFPSYTPEMLESLLYSSSVDLGTPGYDVNYGWGRIDAASAIYGVQKNDLKASITGPSVIPVGSNGTVLGIVKNVGTFDQFNVSVNLFLNGSIIISEIFDYLPSGGEITLPFEFYTSTPAVYDFFLEVIPVPGENVTENNYAFKTVIATDPVINPQTGDVLAYGEISIASPYDFKFEIVDDSNPEAVEIWFYFYDYEFREEWHVDIFYLNTFTREMVGPWEIFPYWINPDTYVGEQINLFSSGAPDATVVGETLVNYYGTDIEVWIVDDGFELVMFTKIDGFLIDFTDYNGDPWLFDMTYNTVIADHTIIENSRSLLIEPIFGTLNETSFIELFVQNTGTLGANITIEFIIDNVTNSMIDLFLASGEFQFILDTWIPDAFGIYYILTIAYPLPGEVYLDDNIAESQVNVIDLYNYEVSNPQFNWYDAQLNGYPLGMFGDDVYTTVNMPFDFEYYGTLFNQVHISSNGWMSFFENAPFHYWTEPFPTLEHPYAVAPFFSDLKVEDNVFAWVTPEFVVIQYTDVFYLWDELAGTFEVVFFPNGDILFQYGNMGMDQGTVKGLNYGLNLNYFSSLNVDLSYVPDYAVKFNIPGSTGPEEDILVADLYVPALNEGESGYIVATVTNIANVSAFDVALLLSINGEQVSYLSTVELPAGMNLTMIYYWQNVPSGDYTISAFAFPVIGETVIDNNEVIEFISIGGLHDISVSLDIYFDGVRYYITGFVMNIGKFDESYITLLIYIDGAMVNLADISFLGVGQMAMLTYIWNNPAFGTYEIMVEAYPVEDETSISDNIVVDFLIVEELELYRNTFNVYDDSTGLPIADAEIYLYNFDTGQSFFGVTNITGSWMTSLPSGYYALDVIKDGYEYFYNEFGVNASEGHHFIYLIPTSSGDQFTQDFFVFDEVSGQPVADAEINIWNFNTGEYFWGLTDIDGYFTIDLPEGDYGLDIYKDGYAWYSTNFYVNQASQYFIFLTPLSNDFYTNAFYIIDEATGLPIEFADINVYGFTTGDYYFGQSDTDGYWQVDLREDEYALDIFKDGYAWSSTTFIVFPDNFTEHFIYLTPLSTTYAIHGFNVLDMDTGLPIEGAEIYVDGYESGEFFYGITDVFGYWEVVLREGEYGLNIFRDGYGYFYDTFFSVGENYTGHEIYLTPLSNNFYWVVFQITDQVTGLPIAGANIELYNPLSSEWYNYQSNATGTLQVQLREGEWWLYVDAIDYIQYSAVIFVSPPDLQLIEVFLTNINDLTFEVISPTNGDLIEGGLVHVYFDASSLQDMTITMYVNGIFTGIAYVTLNNDFMVPVYTNGTNIIDFEVTWGFDVTIFVSLEINSHDVLPVAIFTPGDVYDLRISHFDGTISDFNFTVIEMISPFEVYLNLTYHRYYGDITEELASYYLVVNVLNGFIGDTNMWWGDMHFIIFSHLRSPNVIDGGNLDGNAVFFNWADVFTIVGEDTWNGYEVWVMENIWGEISMVLKDTGMLVFYQSDYGQYYVEVVNTNLLPQSTIDPSISEPDDLSIELGSLGNSIEWIGLDENPDIFELYIDGILVVVGPWISNTSIIISIDGLSNGTHYFEIILYDLDGGMVSDLVLVSVQDTTAPNLSTPDDLVIAEGDTNASISWDVYDLEPSFYMLYLNGIEIAVDNWDNSAPVTYMLGDLLVGNYEFMILVYDNSGNSVQDTVLVTVEVAAESIDPNVQGIPDFSYEEESSDNSIIWNALDDNPSHYEIYMDEELVQEGLWTNNMPITIDIDGLESGRYEFVLIVFDDFDNVKSNTVVVYVLPGEEDLSLPPGQASGFDAFIAILSIFALGFVGRKLSLKRK